MNGNKNPRNPLNPKKSVIQRLRVKQKNKERKVNNFVVTHAPAIHYYGKSNNLFMKVK